MKKKPKEIMSKKKPKDNGVQMGETENKRMKRKKGC